MLAGASSSIVSPQHRLQFTVITPSDASDGFPTTTQTSLSVDELVHLAQQRSKLLFTSGLLRARDLVVLDLDAPYIAVRKLCVVFTLPPIRGLRFTVYRLQRASADLRPRRATGLVLPNRLLLLSPPAGGANYVPAMGAKMREFSKQAQFELCALESVFSVVTEYYETTFSSLKAQAAKTLAHVAASRTSATLDMLRDSLGDIEKLGLQVTACRNTVNALLSDDTYLEISFAHMMADPERFMGTDLPANSEGEMILEAAIMQLNGVLSPLRTEVDQLHNAEFGVKRALALAHNQITFISVSIQALIGACTVGTMFSAIFAMNLASGIPWSDTTLPATAQNISLFWCLASLMLCGPIIFVAFTWKRIRRLAYQ